MSGSFEILYSQIRATEHKAAVCSVNAALAQAQAATLSDLPALKFLHCCLTQVRLDVVCSCRELAPGHTYYEHLCRWFMELVSSKAPSFKFDFTGSLKQQLLVLHDAMLKYYNAANLRDPVLDSMYLTLAPFLMRLIRLSDTYSAGQIEILVAACLRYRIDSAVMVYVRLAAEMQPQVLGPNTRISPLGFSLLPPEYHQLDNFDLRGSQFRSISWEGFSFNHSNFGLSVFQDCDTSGLRITNCRLDSITVHPSSPEITNYCQQQPYIPPSINRP